jgi:hypothetical protein
MKFRPNVSEYRKLPKRSEGNLRKVRAEDFSRYSVLGEGSFALPYCNYTKERGKRKRSDPLSFL